MCADLAPEKRTIPLAVYWALFKRVVFCAYHAHHTQDGETDVHTPLKNGNNIIAVRYKKVGVDNAQPEYRSTTTPPYQQSSSTESRVVWVKKSSVWWVLPFGCGGWFFFTFFARGKQGRRRPSTPKRPRVSKDFSSVKALRIFSCDTNEIGALNKQLLACCLLCLNSTIGQMRLSSRLINHSLTLPHFQHQTTRTTAAAARRPSWSVHLVTLVYQVVLMINGTPTSPLYTHNKCRHPTPSERLRKIKICPENSTRGFRKKTKSNTESLGTRANPTKSVLSCCVGEKYSSTEWNNFF